VPPGATVPGLAEMLGPVGVAVRVGVGPPGVTVRVGVAVGPLGVAVRVGVDVRVGVGPPGVAVRVGVAVGVAEGPEPTPKELLTARRGAYPLLGNKRSS